MENLIDGSLMTETVHGFRLTLLQPVQLSEVRDLPTRSLPSRVVVVILATSKAAWQVEHQLTW